jgi:putative sterol carrier protein
MSMDTAVGGREAAEGKSVSGPSLAGLSGQLRLDVGGRPARVMVVHDGTLTIRTINPTEGPLQSEAIASCDNEETLAAFNRGVLNPVVAMLQGRLSIAGDRAFAIKLILALQAVIRPPPVSARALKSPESAGKEV